MFFREKAWEYKHHRRTDQKGQDQQQKFTALHQHHTKCLNYVKYQENLNGIFNFEFKKLLFRNSPIQLVRRF
jgi:hypothetical protein